MGRTNPDSIAFAQVTLIESHPQHAPSISPASAASRISAVPLKPSTTLIGRPRMALSNCGKAEVALPGPRLPSLTDRLEADHSSRFLIPVFSVRTHVCRSGAGVPKPAESLAIKHHALVPEYMLENHRPREMTDRQSIGISLVVYIIGRYQISRAGHVLNDGAGRSGNMFANMTRGYPAYTCRTLHPELCTDNKNQTSFLCRILVHEPWTHDRKSQRPHPISKLTSAARILTDIDSYLLVHGSLERLSTFS